MEIEIIQTSAYEDKLSPTREFGLILNRVLSVIKMVHWYTDIYDEHIILGKLYDDLSDLFDKLQEEIIICTKDSAIPFPSFGGVELPDNIGPDKEDVFTDCRNNLKYYHITTDAIKIILTSLELNNFISNVKSGIPNTIDDIMTRINKSNYLLEMIKHEKK